MKFTGHISQAVVQRGRFTLSIVLLAVALSAGSAQVAVADKPATAAPTATSGLQGKKTPPKAPLSPGEKLYQAKCGRCHDLPNPGFVAEETWNRWMMRMRYTARLSDMDYDALMDYARQQREARQAAKGK